MCVHASAQDMSVYALCVFPTCGVFHSLTFNPYIDLK